MCCTLIFAVGSIRRRSMRRFPFPSPGQNRRGSSSEVMRYLHELYPNGVPDRRPRKRLLSELAKRDPALERLDWKTLRRAIEQYDSSLADID
jgi:hypothetical protein